MRIAARTPFQHVNPVSTKGGERGSTRGPRIRSYAMSHEAKMEKGESVRSVERAIELLEVLNRRPLSTIQDLHDETGLPKSSLIRLLRTLEAEGLVAQSASYSAYRLLGGVTSLSDGFPREAPIVEAAEEMMIDFTRREGWPLALALFDDDAMVVRASTIPYTSLATVQSSLNLRLSLVGFALGRAFLAHCSTHEQKALIETARHSSNPADRIAQDMRATRKMLRQVRERGYATRAPGIWPQSSTFAVPLYERRRLVGSLGLTWLTAAMPMRTALDQFVPRVSALAETISRSLDSRARTRTAIPN